MVVVRCVCVEESEQQTQNVASFFFFFFVATNALYMKKRNNPKGLIYLFASVCFFHNKSVDELT